MKKNGEVLGRRRARHPGKSQHPQLVGRDRAGRQLRRGIHAGVPRAGDFRRGEAAFRNQVSLRRTYRSSTTTATTRRELAATLQTARSLKPKRIVVLVPAAPLHPHQSARGRVRARCCKLRNRVHHRRLCRFSEKPLQGISGETHRRCDGCPRRHSRRLICPTLRRRTTRSATRCSRAICSSRSAREMSTRRARGIAAGSENAGGNARASCPPARSTENSTSR